ncbi:hypothetical protein [Mesorhizobium sp. BR-1-1-10]|uniref:hypothetical protein n=1 Tax=Mesorhizobium sp. BR-1-1-10 TaxID=2876660 RepID=UPI001CD0A4DC|nr:hypothetical protein [Mesorhizobium sp. BR-1-1-10]MBZ9975466.1 hypothetical protein [Mesorhizobium sp. BR-1-1-10]
MFWEKLIGALLKALEPYLPGLAAFLAGREWQQSQQALKDLKRVEDATRAAAIVDHLSDDNVVQQLKKRGLYRVSGK